MKLDNILKYQDIDMNFYKLERQYKKSEEVKGLNLLHNKYKEKLNDLNHLGKEVKELINSFDKNNKKMKELEALEKEINKDIKTIKDPSELDLYNKGLIKYEECISSIDKEVGRVIKRLGEIKVETQKLHEKIMDLGKRYKAQRKLRDRKKEEMQEKAKPYIIKLKELKKDIDSELMKKYYSLREARKMPAFVVYQDGNCTGCGMKIDIEVENKLKKSGDFAECPECRRLVYKA